MSDEPFTDKKMPPERPFMRELTALIDRHIKDGTDLSEIAGDLERSLATVDNMQLDDFGQSDRPFDEETLRLDDSGPARGQMPKIPDDRDHRIAQLEATVKELYAKLK
jgi:hypothetical protein